MKYFAVSLWASLLLFPHAGFAASLQEARTALHIGNYDAAFTQANALGTSDGLLLAVEILNTKVMLGESSAPKIDSKLAMRLSKQVLAAHPNSAEGKMLYAYAYGFNARSASTLTALRKKLPQKILAVIHIARESNPADARSDALLAGWHFSVVSKAGAKRAQKLFGANEAAGHEYFGKALTLAPDDMLVRGNYIMMLAALGKKQNRAQAKALLQDIQHSPSHTASEKTMVSLLHDLLEIFNEPKRARRSAKTFLDW